MTTHALTTFVVLAVAVASARAQDGSLMTKVVRQAPGVATLDNSSFIYQTLPPEAMARPLEVQSVIRVLVDYRSVMLSEGDSETIKVGSFSSALTDWIKFDGRDIFPAPQSQGDPTISGQLNSQSVANSDIEQRESLTFPIAATVVDIRPNGNLVIEGRREIRVNEEVWMTYLTGTVPRQMIGPDWTVRDSSIADLRIDKYEVGAVRDGYSRGWLARWYGKYKAF